MDSPGGPAPLRPRIIKEKFFGGVFAGSKWKSLNINYIKETAAIKIVRRTKNRKLQPSHRIWINKGLANEEVVVENVYVMTFN